MRSTDTDSLSQLAALARVPEHSRAFMEAMSQGQGFTCGPYFFLAAPEAVQGRPDMPDRPDGPGEKSGASGADWLMAVAYPLRGKYSHAAFEEALDQALRQSGATSCWAIGPDLPPRLQAQVTERDRYYLLSAQALPPARLRGPLRQAAAALRVEESTEFTAAHRRLWAEFMGRTKLAPNVRELYARTPDTLARLAEDRASGAADNRGLRLLNAWDQEGRLAACLLLDFGPTAFCSYILGAHSRAPYTPHAADLLFEAMLAAARREGKRYIHLGLGVNEGILRFKRKWGARPGQAFVMASWQEAPRAGKAAEGKTDWRQIVSLLQSIPQAASKHSAAPQRRFAMLWEVEKNGRISWLGGSAHFFCYSFESSFIRLFRKVDTVVFEGPLDEDFMAAVDQAGKRLSPGQAPLASLLTEAEIRRLERVVRGPEGPLARWLNMEAAQKTDVRWLLRHARPWCAFFTLWTGFLERQGWRESVDMEAWRIAQSMGKRVVGMETLEEQLAALDFVPLDRVLRFFRACRGWKGQARRNARAYLTGDLERMLGSSAEFPTRTEHVIDVRDQRFRERMRPYLEEGGCAVFVGTAHLLNLRHMLVEDGFHLRRCLSLGGRLRQALLGRGGEVTW